MAIKSLPVTHKRQQADIALAIVNIVLLLIFFFLITGRMTSAPSFAVELSETAVLPVESLPKPILELKTDGTMWLNGEQVDEVQLANALADSPVLHLLMDRNESASLLLDQLARPEFSHLMIRLVTVHRKGDGAGGTGS